MTLEKPSSYGILLYTLPLYASPVLAGWSLAPLAVIPVCTLLFVAVSLVSRKLPEEAGPLMITLARTLLTNAALAGGLYALGRGGASIVGELKLPVWQPLALCTAAAAYGGWKYRWTQEMDQALSEAIDTIQDMSTAPHAVPDPDLLQALDALEALPQQFEISQIDAIVRRLERKLGPDGFVGLFTQATRGDLQTELALMRYVARPDVRRHLEEKGTLRNALLLGIDSDHGAVRHEAAHLLDRMIEDEVDPALFPDLTYLRTREVAFPEQFAGITEDLTDYLPKEDMAEDD